MKKPFIKDPEGQIPQTTHTSQILRGRDLKDYRIIPDFELKERIVGDKAESAKTNLLEKTTEIGNTAVTTSG
jgi:hypothetical protein